MRIMTYNIFDGAQNTFKEVISVIKSVKPDILTLNEANGFEENQRDRLKKLAEETNLKYYFLSLCGDGYIYHTAILSKYPLISCTNILPASRTMLVSEIQVNSKAYHIVSAHLSPFSEEARVKEVGSLTNHLTKLDNVVITGDLNSLSPDDNYPKNMINNLNEGQYRKFVSNNKVQYKVLSSLADKGFIDCATQLKQNEESTVPTKVDHHEDHFENRLDYILVSKNLSEYICNYEVIKNTESDRASDHYPVYVDLQV